MRKPIVLCLLLSLQCFICGCDDSSSEISGALSTSVLTGRVTDLQGQAVEGAAITISGISTTYPTNGDGTFALNAPSGEQTLSATKDGFIEVQRKVHVPESVTVSAQPISVSFVLPPQQADYANLALTTAKDVYLVGENAQFNLTVSAGDQHGLRVAAYDLRVKRDGVDVWTKNWTYSSKEVVAAGGEYAVGFEWDWSEASFVDQFINCVVEAKVTMLVDIAFDEDAQPLPFKGALQGQYIEYRTEIIPFSLDNRP